MAITLPRFANGDTDYVGKHNTSAAQVEAALNALQAQLGGGILSAVNSGVGFESLFGKTAVRAIGATSYNCTGSGSTLTVTAGYAWLPALQSVVGKATSTALSFTGKAAATYYIVLDSAGTPSISTTNANAIASVAWTGAAFGVITDLCVNALRVIDLVDAPAAYTGAANKVLTVKADESGIEFSAAAAPSSFPGLSDTPDSYAGQANKVVQVKGDETGLEFGALAPSTLLGLTDAPDAYTGKGGFAIRVKEDETGVEFVEVGPGEGGGAVVFTELGDVPTAYAGYANKVVRVKADESGLEFATGASATSFTDLTDAPPTFAGAALRVVQVRADESGLEYSDMATPSSFLGLLDAPDDYAGAGGMLVAVKGDETGVEFLDPAVYVTAADFVAALAAALADYETAEHAAETYAPKAQPYVMASMFNGAPTASMVVLRHKVVVANKLVAGLTGSYFIAEVAATAQTDFDITVNGVSKGTLRFAVGGTSATFLFASDVDLVPGDLVKVIGPVTPDATLADLACSFLGAR